MQTFKAEDTGITVVVEMEGMTIPYRCTSQGAAAQLAEQINRGALLMDLTPEQIKSINWAKVPGLVEECRRVEEFDGRLDSSILSALEAVEEVEGR